MLAPAYLFSGPPGSTEKQCIQFLQKQFCVQHCKTCFTCLSIASKTYHATHWVRPENRYTKDALVPIFEKIQFALDVQEHQFFILERTEDLSTACANSLLKMVEEPPHGYHFIFLSKALELVIETIRSRCLAIRCTQEESHGTPMKLFTHFVTKNPDPIVFLKDVQASKITETECVELLTHLTKIHSAQYNEAYADDTPTKNLEKILAILHAHLAQPPMPASAALYLKNLYLQLHQATGNL